MVRMIVPEQADSAENRPGQLALAPDLLRHLYFSAESAYCPKSEALKLLLPRTIIFPRSLPYVVCVCMHQANIILENPSTFSTPRSLSYSVVAFCLRSTVQ